jgi:hypothetical protein
VAVSFPNRIARFKFSPSYASGHNKPFTFPPFQILQFFGTQGKHHLSFARICEVQGLGRN